MLNPTTDRLDYGDLLIPPAGFKVSEAVATTYSLDLETLLSIPLALNFSKNLDIDFKEEIVQIHEAIRRTPSILTLYCQKGNIKVPEIQQILYSYLEKCIVEIVPRKSSSFHPKVWVLRYEEIDGRQIRYRVLVMSRNMTLDKSWDVVAELDGVLGRKSYKNKNAGISDFVRYLARKGRKRKLSRIIKELSFVDFNINGLGATDFHFHPIGIPLYHENPVLQKPFDKLLVISPFLSNGMVKKLYECSKYRHLILISRKDEMDRRLEKGVVEDISAYHLIDDYVESEFKFDIDADGQQDALKSYHDIHAKLYSTKTGWNSSLFIGSANASEVAFSRNVEFLLELSGRNSRIGYSMIFKELIKDKNSLFQEYKCEQDDTLKENEAEKHEDTVRKIQYELIKLSVQGEVISLGGNLYDVVIDVDLRNVENVVPHNYKIACYLFLHKQSIKPLKKSIVNTVRWSNIVEAELSSFLVFLITKTPFPLKQFIVKVNLKKMPAGRYDSIFNMLIDNAEKFFRYIHFLLSDNYVEEALIAGKYKKGWKTGVPLDIFGKEPIFEELLKAASRDHNRIVYIDQITEKLSQELQKQPEVEQFLKFWASFRKLIPHKKRKQYGN